MAVSFMLAWDEFGHVIATCEQLVGTSPEGVRGFVDAEAHERGGERMRRLWNVNGAVGSGSWPEFLGGKAHDFDVILDGDGLPLITALVHRRSGHIRERSAIEAALAVEGASRWRICGTPSEPLQVDDEGRTI
jgi:hypothetical protein